VFPPGGEQRGECLYLGVNFSAGGQTSPLGVNSCCKNWPLVIHTQAAPVGE
jgi:hypothetical protein